MADQPAILGENMSRKQESKDLSEIENALVADIQRIKQEHQARVEGFTPPCPKDGLASQYFGETGNGQRLAYLYQCPRGDIFSWNFAKQMGRIVVSPQEGTPRADK